MLNTTHVSGVSHSAIRELPQHCCILCTVNLPGALLEILPAAISQSQQKKQEMLSAALNAK